MFAQMPDRDVIARAGDHLIFVMRVVEYRAHSHRLGLAVADDRVDPVAAFLRSRAGQLAPQADARRIDMERAVGAGQGKFSRHAHFAPRRGTEQAGETGLAAARGHRFDAITQSRAAVAK